MRDAFFNSPHAGCPLPCLKSSALKFCLVLVLVAFGAVELRAAPHRYDHVVIVIEENHTQSQIIGDRANAPYMNSLADGGVRVGSMFAITHPSQPNYIHLFSGANQGVTDDNLVAGYPFSAMNLGASLLAAGYTFAGYSQGLEAAGGANWADYDPHTGSGVDYRRRHNPWANWVAKTSPVPANQIPGTLNKAFTQFPANFSTLPTVSFVVPDLDHDMHNGTVRQADDWLSANLGAYATWAKANNSLLIITWDEDDNNGVNQIPTIFYGAALRDGTVLGGTWTLHNLLRTIEDMYGVTTHAGSAAQVRSMTGAFTNDPSSIIVQAFRQGLGGYAGAQDTQVRADSPNTSYAASDTLVADLDTTAGLPSHALIRFNSIFGTGAGQIPTNATIYSAKLIFHTPSGGSSQSINTFRLHRMAADWTDTATWNSVGSGISPDGIEAVAAPSFSLIPTLDGGPAIFDVTSDVELFRGGTINRGWALLPYNGTDGWTFMSSEAANASQRPGLEIVYTLPVTVPPYIIWANSHSLTGTNALTSADPDLDGIPNIVEFACNLDPNVSDAKPLGTNGVSGLPVGKYNVAGNYLEVEYLRRKGSAATNLTYTVQFAKTPTGPTWSPSVSPVITPIDSEWERVKTRDIVTGATNRFGKVVVTYQP